MDNIADELLGSEGIGHIGVGIGIGLSGTGIGEEEEECTLKAPPAASRHGYQPTAQMPTFPTDSSNEGTESDADANANAKPAAKQPPPQKPTKKIRCRKDLTPQERQAIVIFLTERLSPEDRTKPQRGAFAEAATVYGIDNGTARRVWRRYREQRAASKNGGVDIDFRSRKFGNTRPPKHDRQELLQRIQALPEADRVSGRAISRALQVSNNLIHRLISDGTIPKDIIAQEEAHVAKARRRALQTGGSSTKKKKAKAPSKGDTEQENNTNNNTDTSTSNNAHNNNTTNNNLEDTKPQATIDETLDVVTRGNNNPFLSSFQVQQPLFHPPGFYYQQQYNHNNAFNFRQQQQEGGNHPTAPQNNNINRFF